MLPPFGFSVGDFFSGINLIRELIKALEDSAGSSAEYRDLIKELYSLERALLEVKHLDLEESQHSQHVALKQVAIQCQETIDGFLNKIRKFQPALGTGGSNSSWKNGLRKVEWTLYKKDDVQKLRAQLNGHTTSINILLMTVQLQISSIQGRRLESQQDKAYSQDEKLAVVNQGIASNRQILNSHTDLILALTKVASSAATKEQNQDLKTSMLKILKTNLQLYDIILSMQANLPQQMERQQPVLFLDACGRLSPVHLEFITSAEAFLAVLKIRFQDAGLRKIEKGQFALEETRSKRQIDLRRPWQTCLLPGQKIDMSMIFSRVESARFTCPGCQHEAGSKTTQDVECPSCGIHYRRILEVQENSVLQIPQAEIHSAEPRSPSSSNPHKRQLPDGLNRDTHNHADGSEESESEPEDDVHMFRRVHIKAKKATNHVQWSTINKHTLLKLDNNGLDISLTANRTVSDMYQDELYNPTMAQPARQQQVQGNTVPSHRSAFIDLLQVANTGHLTARSASSAVNAFLQRSPFRESSQFAVDKVHSNPSSPADATRLTSISPLRLQQKQEADAHAYAQHHPPSRPEYLNPPKTISPKEAHLDFDNDEVDLRVRPALFSGHQFIDGNEPPNLPNIDRIKKRRQRLTLGPQTSKSDLAGTTDVVKKKKRKRVDSEGNNAIDHDHDRSFRPGPAMVASMITSSGPVGSKTPAS